MKVLFVDHRYHAKTGSSLFLVDLLKRFFDVTVLYEDSLPPGKPLTSASLGVHAFDAVVLFQIGTGDLGRRIRHKNLVFFPMYDSLDSDSLRMWHRLQDVKVVSLSRAVHEKALSYGGNSLHVQYYPQNNSKISEEKTGRGVFFWPRNTGVTWKDVRLLMGNYNCGFVHLHKSADPGQNPEYPTEVETKAYNVQYSGWFPEKKQYLQLLEKCTFFISPRLKEGVGISFLEAMSHGCVVIAANRPTMNEYITDGQNGLLFDPANPTMLDFSEVLRLSRNAIDSAADGRARWQKSEEVLIDFIMTSDKSLKRTKGKGIAIIRRSVFDLGLIRRLRSFHLLKHILPYGLVMTLKKRKDKTSKEKGD